MPSSPSSADNDEALVKVLEHLKNIKLESQETIFSLSQELKRVNAALSECTQREDRLHDEVEFRLGQIEELKRLQTNKHRLEALDDWKALVQQLQVDRRRLEGEVEKMRGERGKLVAELRKHVGTLPKEGEGGEGGGGGGEREEALQLLAASSSGVNGGGEVDEEDLGLDGDPEKIKQEMERLRKANNELELQNRRSALELQRLREEVRRADSLLQRGGGGGNGSGGLLYSLGSYFFTRKSSRQGGNRRSGPVIQV